MIFVRIMKTKMLVKKFEFFAAFMIVLFFGVSIRAQSLTVTDVQTIIAQAVSKATSLNRKVTVSVTDKEGNLLGTFAMTDAPDATVVRSVGRAGQGLENFNAKGSAALAAQSKAGTAGIFSAGGNAFSTRTASFIIQEHFPAGVDFTSGGPLYGVQFSTLPCSDVAIAGLPFGLSGDPGGVPLYKNGAAVGGVGVEGDGLYTIDRSPYDNDQSFEEAIAIYATRGYESPTIIRADNILVGGLRFPFANSVDSTPVSLTPFGSLSGTVLSPIKATPASDFIATTLNGVSGLSSSRFPTVAGSALSAAEVNQILGNAAAIANKTRAGIRQPIGTTARVTMSVVDTDGKVLGIFRQLEAPVFGLDVAVQKARTANFFARPDAAIKLAGAGFGSYVSRAATDGVALNGSVAYSDRAIGFLHRPLFPDGINDTPAGPFSSLLADWSPFNVGLQSDLVRNALIGPPQVCYSTVYTKRKVQAPCPCTAINEIRNGLQIFAGGLPIYRGSTLVGAIGVSGDGIDQDDLVAAGGANTFAAPEAIRSDKFFVRAVRLPFLKFPVRPFID
ncbi:hypothetical protein BH10ACI2_BH10ACI2_03010 [soil metagenome]